MVYTIPVTGSELRIAWGPPFLPSDAEELLQRISQRVSEFKTFRIGQDRGGRSVNGIRIGSETARYQVWVNARQHAWEAGGSHVGRGFADWISSDHPVAKALRAETCIYYVPIMDVDNVVLGAGGKDALPRDHNRDWADDANYPEVAAAQNMIRSIHERHGLDVYIDLHNPGRRSNILLWTIRYPDLPEKPLVKYRRWIELAAKNIREPVPLAPEYRFATYVTTDEERGRMSSGWVRNLRVTKALA